MPADLDMALDEMIESSWGKNGKGKGRGKGKPFSKGRGSGGQGQKLDMTLDEIVDTSSAGKGNSKGKGTGKDNGSWESWGEKSYDKSYEKSSNFGGSSWNGGGSSKGGQKGWGKSTKGNPSKGSSGGAVPHWMEHDDWRLDADNADDSSWEPPSRSGGWSRSSGNDDRNDSWSNKGWGKSSKGSHAGYDDRRSYEAPRSLPAEGRGYAVGSTSSWRRVEDEVEARSARSGGGGRRGSALAAVAASAVARAGVGEKRPRPGRRGRDDEDDDEEDARPPPRTRVRTVAAQVRTAPKSIKVTNIPKELKAADVREAFESETGKVVLCELARGTAHLTFAKAKDAQKAVDTFDRGELNGKIITVVLEN